MASVNGADIDSHDSDASSGEESAPENTKSGTTKSSRSTGNVLLDSKELAGKLIHCTSCRQQIHQLNKSSFGVHPELKVLVCRKCKNYVTQSDWTKDSQGNCEQCTWCGEGGDVLLCDGCPRVFCRKCIRHNLGRSQAFAIDAAHEWKCFVCEDLKSLEHLTTLCKSVVALHANQPSSSAASRTSTGRGRQPTKGRRPRAPMPFEANPKFYNKRDTLYLPNCVERIVQTSQNVSKLCDSIRTEFETLDADAGPVVLEGGKPPGKSGGQVVGSMVTNLIESLELHAMVVHNELAKLKAQTLTIHLKRRVKAESADGRPESSTSTVSSNVPTASSSKQKAKRRPVRKSGASSRPHSKASSVRSSDAAENSAGEDSNADSYDRPSRTEKRLLVKFGGKRKSGKGRAMRKSEKFEFSASKPDDIDNDGEDDKSKPESDEESCGNEPNICASPSNSVSDCDKDGDTGSEPGGFIKISEDNEDESADGAEEGVAETFRAVLSPKKTNFKKKDTGLGFAEEGVKDPGKDDLSIDDDRSDPVRSPPINAETEESNEEVIDSSKLKKPPASTCGRTDESESEPQSTVCEHVPERETSAAISNDSESPIATAKDDAEDLTEDCNLSDTEVYLTESGVKVAVKENKAMKCTSDSRPESAMAEGVEELTEDDSDMEPLSSRFGRHTKSAKKSDATEDAPGSQPKIKDTTMKDKAKPASRKRKRSTEAVFDLSGDETRPREKSPNTKHIKRKDTATKEAEDLVDSPPGGSISVVDEAAIDLTQLSNDAKDIVQSRKKKRLAKKSEKGDEVEGSDSCNDVSENESIDSPDEGDLVAFTRRIEGKDGKSSKQRTKKSETEEKKSSKLTKCSKPDDKEKLVVEKKSDGETKASDGGDNNEKTSNECDDEKESNVGENSNGGTKSDGENEIDDVEKCDAEKESGDEQKSDDSSGHDSDLDAELNKLARFDPIQSLKSDISKSKTDRQQKKKNKKKKCETNVLAKDSVASDEAGADGEAAVEGGSDCGEAVEDAEAEDVLKQIMNNSTEECVVTVSDNGVTENILDTSLDDLFAEDSAGKSAPEPEEPMLCNGTAQAVGEEGDVNKEEGSSDDEDPAGADDEKNGDDEVVPKKEKQTTTDKSKKKHKKDKTKKVENGNEDSLDGSAESSAVKEDKMVNGVANGVEDGADEDDEQTEALLSLRIPKLKLSKKPADSESESGNKEKECGDWLKKKTEEEIEEAVVKKRNLRKGNKKKELKELLSSDDDDDEKEKKEGSDEEKKGSDEEKKGSDEEKEKDEDDDDEFEAEEAEENEDEDEDDDLFDDEADSEGGKAESSEDGDDADYGAKKSKKKGKGGDKKKKSKHGKEKKGKKKKRKRKRVKTDSDSEAEAASDSNEVAEGSGEDELNEDGTPKKKKIRKIMKNKKLTQETKDAFVAELERKKRLDEKQQKYNSVTLEQIVASVSTSGEATHPEARVKSVILDVDEDGEPLIQVHPRLLKALKPHQAEGVRHMYDCMIENYRKAEKGDKGGGAILAHCMGLGKTLQVITLIHTLLSDPKLNLKTVLVVAPLNTVLNWVSEFQKWLCSPEGEEEDESLEMNVWELANAKDNWTRTDYCNEWMDEGGIMVMGYEMYRSLAGCLRIKNKKQKTAFKKAFTDPGPDIVVCDEGHILKNEASAISKQMSMISTLRRVCLTGTPLQNNLIEYHTMVQFVKPALLGTKKEFQNRFANPIKAGQTKDASSWDVKLMKRRAHVLHDLLDRVVHRRDYTALRKFLPAKLEYVLSIRLSDKQVALYKAYLTEIVGTLSIDALRARRSLFADFQMLARVWTHPFALIRHQKTLDKKAEALADEEDMQSFVDDEDDLSDMSSDSDSEKKKKKTNKNGNKDVKPAAVCDDEIVEIPSDSNDANLGPSTSRGRGKGRKLKGEDSDDDAICLASDDDTKDGDKSLSEASDAEKEVVKQYTTRSRRGAGAEDVEDFAAMFFDPEKINEKIGEGKWWRSLVDDSDEFVVETSGKLSLLFEVIRRCEAIGDKLLVFSQSLISLDIMEHLLQHFADAGWTSRNDSLAELYDEKWSWERGVDYLRLDGSTNANNRKLLSNQFNDPLNLRCRLFLISTKAGSLGINLTAANRVIIFDASWNPSHDIQSIFRVYRFGQVKPVYVYRFIASGTMEDKIYDRQVTKESLACRVVDEQQIERHFTSADLMELYHFNETPTRDENPKLPKDQMLADLLLDKNEWIVKYHEHESLLSHIEDEVLNEAERKAAWEEYTNEKEGRQGLNMVNQQIENLINQGNQFIRMSGQKSDITMQMLVNNLKNEADYADDPTKLVQQLSAIVMELRNRATEIQQNKLRQQQEAYKQRVFQLLDAGQFDQITPELIRYAGLSQFDLANHPAFHQLLMQQQRPGTSAVMQQQRKH